MIALGALVAILSHFRLSSRRAALGLPEGSVQAVIALVLVLIFAITAVFVLTLEIDETNQIMERLATQVLTTTGTLAVAVAGFYFGTRAVEAGSQAATTAVQTAGGAGPGSVRVATPASPATLAKDPGASLSIEIATVPDDAGVLWSVTGDDLGEVVQLGPTNFEYRRGPSAADEVVIKFQLARDPSATAALTILPPAAPTGATTQPTPPPTGEASTARDQTEVAPPPGEASTPD